ncbi:hypothetical protein [Caldisalinibacter kiritimatiensis]|uniref:Uncharacterized protein n=1 Tax=Caldisalinibacter kiritimatiensis TaxID=1304284 RepID=R1AW55_9FIRM|nr:hypothetical protein [Caldisalinibacter kiritimatiensis]EOD01403.1 hypothetical protein L21TH_0525 [Caldisalinibacter kiritimatiensis]
MNTESKNVEILDKIKRIAIRIIIICLILILFLFKGLGVRLQIVNPDDYLFLDKFQDTEFDYVIVLKMHPDIEPTAVELNDSSDIINLLKYIESLELEVVVDNRVANYNYNYPIYRIEFNNYHTGEKLVVETINKNYIKVVAFTNKKSTKDFLLNPSRKRNITTQIYKLKNFKSNKHEHNELVTFLKSNYLK